VGAAGVGLRRLRRLFQRRPRLLNTIAHTHRSPGRASPPTSAGGLAGCRVMHTGQEAASSLQQRETGARSPTDQLAGTAAQAVGPPPQPEPAPSERCSSASPTRSIEAHEAQQRQEEAEAAAVECAEVADQLPASALPHAQPSEAAGRQEPALLLQLLAEEACRAGSVATGAETKLNGCLQWQTQAADYMPPSLLVPAASAWCGDVPPQACRRTGTTHSVL
jgi:hypothetical protein